MIIFTFYDAGFTIIRLYFIDEQLQTDVEMHLTKQLLPIKHFW